MLTNLHKIRDKLEDISLKFPNERFSSELESLVLRVKRVLDSAQYLYTKYELHIHAMPGSVVPLLEGPKREDLDRLREIYELVEDYKDIKTLLNTIEKTTREKISREPFFAIHNDTKLLEVVLANTELLELYNYIVGEDGGAGSQASTSASGGESVAAPITPFVIFAIKTLLHRDGAIKDSSAKHFAAAPAAMSVPAETAMPGTNKKEQLKYFQIKKLLAILEKKKDQVLGVQTFAANGLELVRLLTPLTKFMNFHLLVRKLVSPARLAQAKTGSAEVAADNNITTPEELWAALDSPVLVIYRNPESRLDTSFNPLYEFNEQITVKTGLNNAYLHKHTITHQFDFNDARNIKNNFDSQQNNAGFIAPVNDRLDNAQDDSEPTTLFRVYGEFSETAEWYVVETWGANLWRVLGRISEKRDYKTPYEFVRPFFVKNNRPAAYNALAEEISRPYRTEKYFALAQERFEAQEEHAPDQLKADLINKIISQLVFVSASDNKKITKPEKNAPPPITVSSIDEAAFALEKMDVRPIFWEALSAVSIPMPSKKMHQHIIDEIKISRRLQSEANVQNYFRALEVELVGMRKVQLHNLAPDEYRRQLCDLTHQVLDRVFTRLFNSGQLTYLKFKMKDILLTSY